ncbi:amidase family protein [Peptoniphilus harei]|nr:amidase family protein [Peptoniphilus harei]
MLHHSDRRRGSKKAREVDEKFHNREEMSQLAGVPISIKDNIL